MTTVHRPYKTVLKKIVPLPRTRIFEELCNFGGIKELLPDMLVSCHSEGTGAGATRTVVFESGGSASERIDLAYDNTLFVYSLIDNKAPDLLPFSAYVAVVELKEHQEGATQVTWSSNWTPSSPDKEAELNKTLESIYVAVLDNMVKLAWTKKTS